MSAFVPIPDIGKVSQVQYNRARGWGPKAGFPFERRPWEAPIDPMGGVAYAILTFSRNQTKVLAGKYVHFQSQVAQAKAHALSRQDPRPT